MSCGVKPNSGSLRPMEDALRQHGAFADLVGYRLTDWREGAAEVSLEVGPQHLNRSGVLHGGVLTAMIDAACGYAGCYSAPGAPPRRAFTLSMETQFVAAAEAGSRLTVTARKTGGGARIFFARSEARDQEGRLIGQGSAVYRYRGS